MLPTLVPYPVLPVVDGIPEIRTVTKSNVMDFVGYTTPAYGQLIINTVHQALEAKYADFINERPGWDGAVSAREKLPLA